MADAEGEKGNRRRGGWRLLRQMCRALNDR